LRPSTAGSASSRAKVEVTRLPAVEGWVLARRRQRVADRRAAGNLRSIRAGIRLPGVGRIDAIRRQDGRWAVVTSKGLIVAR